MGQTSLNGHIVAKSGDAIYNKLTLRGSSISSLRAMKASHGNAATCRQTHTRLMLFLALAPARGQVGGRLPEGREQLRRHADHLARSPLQRVGSVARVRPLVAHASV